MTNQASKKTAPLSALETIRARLLERAEQRNANLERIALESDQAGDTANAAFSRAAIAENNRFIEKLNGEKA